MKQVLIDFNRLRENPFNGLFQFSKNLAASLSSLSNLEDIHLSYYLPKTYFNTFGNRVGYVPHTSLDKYYMSGTSKYDVWHTTNQISWYRPFNKKTKRILTIHDLNFLIEERNNHKRNKRLLNDIQKRIDASQYITAISKYALKVAEEHLNLHDIPRSVVYNGGDLQAFPDSTEVKYKPRKPFLFSIGSLQPRKNFHSLICLLEHSDFELVIAGNNNYPYKQQVIDEAKKLNVLDKLKLIGPVSDEEKYWYYNNCEAFLFPSLAEGFGLPIIEAMNVGKPIFLSSETCLPEIGGNLAYYFSSFDVQSMQSVFENGMKHYNINQPQQQLILRAKEFSWSTAAADYFNIYKEVSE